MINDTMPSHVNVNGSILVHHNWRTGLPHRLFVLELVMGFLALPFGALLTVTTLGMPKSMLENTPFESFVIPGLILGFVVGGSMLLAARLTWFEHRWAPVAGFAAGCVLLGWITVEAMMIPSGLPIQIPFAIYALVVMRMAWLFFRCEHNDLKSGRGQKVTSEPGLKPQKTDTIL